MATAQEEIDKFAALQGSGSQIPGIVREGNSYAAAPGSLLRGELDAAASSRPTTAPAAGDTGATVRSGNAFTQAPQPGAALTSSGPTTFDGAGGRYTPERGANPARGIAGFFADSASAARGEGTQATYSNEGRPSGLAPAAYPNEGRPSAIQAANNAPPGYVSKPPRNSFTETGAATQPGAMLRDGFGNDLGPTQAYQGQLDRLRAESAAISQSQQPAERAPGTSYVEQQRADADRFTRFVNESDTARLARDLATGGGTLRTNAGKIAALQNMQLRDAAAQQGELTRAANIIAANTARGAQNVQAKGQQLQHDTALAGILGSPLQQQGQLLDAAIKSGQLNSGQVLQSLQQKLLEASKNKDADSQARYAQLIQQLQGKSPESKLVTIGGGQEVDPSTGALRALPSQLAYTGQAPTIVSANQGQARQAPPAAAIELLRRGGGTPEQFDAIYGPGAAAQYTKGK